MPAAGSPAATRRGPLLPQLGAELALVPLLEQVGDLQLVHDEEQHHQPRGEQQLTGPA